VPRETLAIVRLRRIAATALLAAGALAGPAVAQEPGLVIDPESPSAKEYALPLENERRLADPGTAPDAGVQQGERSSPAFGAGVAAQDASAEDGGAGASGGDGGSGNGGGSTQRGNDGTVTGPGEAEAGDAEDEATVRAATANPGAPDGGAGTLLLVGGVGLAVLLVAGAAGVALRRRAE
jgi:hypothetical protein